MLRTGSSAVGRCLLSAASKVRHGLFVLAMMSLTNLGFAQAELVEDAPATQAQQQAFDEMNFLLGVKRLTGESAETNPESATPRINIKASVSNFNSAKLLGRLWTFFEPIGSTIYTDTYTFTSVDSSKNSDGDYYAWGENKYGNLVMGGYNSDLGRWLIVDAIATSSSYVNAFIFDFIDDNHVSGCYYLYLKTSSSIGTCISFTGSRPAASVTPTSQTITFGSSPTIAAGGTGTVSASASSGLAVTFSSTTPSICAVNGNTVTGLAAGTCTIAANQSGNSSYYAAPQVTRSFTVVASTAATSNAGKYDGIYLWAPGYFLSVHQIGGNTLIGTIYWVHTENSVQIGSRTLPEADTFDLFHGQLIGTTAVMEGTRFYRGCVLNYNFTFNGGSSITVHQISASNSDGVSTSTVNCAAKYNPASDWTIPLIY